MNEYHAYPVATAARERDIPCVPGIGPGPFIRSSCADPSGMHNASGNPDYFKAVFRIFFQYSKLARRNLNSSSELHSRWTHRFYVDINVY
jgi:hypothetical protein